MIRYKKTLLMFVALALVAAACSSGDSSEPSNSEPLQSSTSAPDSTTVASESFTMCFMPKFVGHPVFTLANEGAQEAAVELGDTVNYVGSTEIDVSEQIKWVESCTEQGVDAIIIGALDPDALVPSLTAAADRGILINTWDADVNPEARSIFISTPSGPALGEAMAESLGEMMNFEGQWAWLSSGPTVANQVEWIQATEDYMASEGDRFANMELVTTVYGESDDLLSYEATEGLLARFPDLQGIISPDAAGLPAAARAIQDGGKCGTVWVTGVALPSAMSTYMDDGCTDSFILWDFVDFGYLSVQATHQVLAGAGTASDTVLEVGRMGERTVDSAGVVVLGDPLVFTPDNIDDYDF